MFVLFINVGDDRDKLLWSYALFCHFFVLTNKLYCILFDISESD
jgi:hypothetical protein